MSEQHCTGCSGTDYIGRPCRRVLPKGTHLFTVESLTAALEDVETGFYGTHDYVPDAPRFAAAIIQAALTRTPHR